MATSNNIISLRRHDLDNLRVFLTELVIAHHTAIAYGGAAVPLIGFNAFNQAFFMGLFFGISGRVSALSLSKLDHTPGRGRWGFVKSKLLRLGAPALVYTTVVHPLIRALVLPQWSIASLGDCWSQYFRDTRGVRGPTWYIATLLGFDLVAALLKPKPKPAQSGDRADTPRNPSSINYRTAGKWGWILVAGTSFLIRLYFPVGSAVEILGVQPAYLSQYIYAYALGHLSFDEDQPDLTRPSGNTPARDLKSENPPGCEADSPISQLRIWSAMSLSLLSLPLCFAPSILGSASSSTATALQEAMGGWNLSALAYAIWNEASLVTVGSALIDYFGRWHNGPTASTILRPRYSYAAFLAHALVSTLVEIAADKLILSVPGVHRALLDTSTWKAVGPIIMTGTVSAINIFASFASGRLLVELVPGLHRII